MFTQLARLGVSRAAAFFYAVAVGIAANIIIAHFSPSDTGHPATAETQPFSLKPADGARWALVKMRSTASLGRARPSKLRTMRRLRTTS